MEEMIVYDVRIKEIQGTIGHQHEESFITYYDVQIKVFDMWWSLSKMPEEKRKLQNAVDLRDMILDSIKGRRQ